MAPKVIAHRGSNRKAPQNTLPAFQQAIEEGCDGFETDVHLTKDGVPVICHNYTIDEMSDGVGEISSYTLGELKKFDFGSKFSPEFADTTLPTLDEFLDLVSKTEGKLINIELKNPKKDGDKLVRLTLDAIARYGVKDRVIISSFSPKILRTVKMYDKSCDTALLYPILDLKVSLPFTYPVLLAKSLKASALHPMSAFVTYGGVSLAHKLGLRVNVWTVNNPKTVRFLNACGVDGIITDCPGNVKGYLNGNK